MKVLAAKDEGAGDGAGGPTHQAATHQATDQVAMDQAMEGGWKGRPRGNGGVKRAKGVPRAAAAFHSRTQ